MVYYEMWFRAPMGQVFKLTVSGFDSNEECLRVARANWDYNVSAGFEPVSARP